MSEQQKPKPIKNANALIFILFWVISLAFLQFSSWDVWQNIYLFVADSFPAILQRLWIAYVFHGFVIGLGFGLAQKAAIQALRPIRLQYWVLSSIFLGIAAKFTEYLFIRYIDWQTYNDTSFYFLGLAIAYPILSSLVQWWILRKHFKQASIWLLLLLPTLGTYLFGYSPVGFMNPVIMQALLSALALLWMNYQTGPEEKAKNISEAEARLADSLPGHDEIQHMTGAYRTSEA